jgi:hypothetical protein
MRHGCFLRFSKVVGVFHKVLTLCEHLFTNMNASPNPGKTDNSVASQNSY